MGWSFRKKVTIAPGIRLNLSKSGVSTTIGPRSASINIGKKGVYGNISIPGIGIYKREKLSGNSNKKKQSQQKIATIESTPQPMYVSISSLLKYKDVIEADTLNQLQTFLNNGENHVYIEPGVLAELRRLHNAKHNTPKTINSESKTTGEPNTTEAVIGLLSIVFGVICGCLAYFKFDVSPFLTALISVVPLALALFISKCNSK